MTEDLLPEYFRLLREAFQATETQDNFDLDSSNPESRDEWLRICRNNSIAQMELIAFVNEHTATISFELGIFAVENVVKALEKK